MYVICVWFHLTTYFNVFRVTYASQNKYRNVFNMHYCKKHNIMLSK